MDIAAFTHAKHLNHVLNIYNGAAVLQKYYPTIWEKTLSLRREMMNYLCVCLLALAPLATVRVPYK